MEETDEIRQWMTKYPQKFRIIPYQSVGNEHGVLEGIVVERMMIQQEEGEVVKKEAVVALYKGKLSRGRDIPDDIEPQADIGMKDVFYARAPKGNMS